MNRTNSSHYLKFLLRGQPREVSHVPHHAKVCPLRVGEANCEAELGHEGDLDGLSILVGRVLLVVDQHGLREVLDLDLVGGLVVVLEGDGVVVVVEELGLGVHGEVDVVHLVGPVVVARDDGRPDELLLGRLLVRVAVLGVGVGDDVEDGARPHDPVAGVAVEEDPALHLVDGHGVAGPDLEAVALHDAAVGRVEVGLVGAGPAEKCKDARIRTHG